MLAKALLLFVFILNLVGVSYGASIKDRFESNVKDSKLESKYTYWMDAATYGDIKTISSFIDSKKVDLNYQDKLGVSALILASSRGHLEVVKLLLDAHADTSLRVHRNGCNALYLACDRKNKHTKEIVECLVRTNPSLVNSSADLSGHSALMAASLVGNFGAASILVEHKADLDAQDDDGECALFNAAREGEYEIVSLLLKTKANSDLMTKDGCNALTIAIKNGYQNVVSTLAEHKANLEIYSWGHSQLSIASARDNMQLVSTLVEARADVNSRGVSSNFEFSPIMGAITNKNPHMFKLLLEAKADINLASSDGSSILHYLIQECESSETLFFLRNLGFDVDSSSDSEYSDSSSFFDSDSSDSSSFVDSEASDSEDYD